MNGRVRGMGVVGNSATMTDIPPATGTYTYTVTVTSPLAGGGTCTATSAPYSVTVYRKPVITDAYFDNVECDPYRVTLHAFANETGTFNWSDGQHSENSDESLVTVTGGGPYQVTFTGSSGCQATALVTVPKDPEEYLWIFPTGCYTFCSHFDSGVLIGPSIDTFYRWAWIKNGVADVYGGMAMPDLGVVPDYPLAGSSNNYNLELLTGYCTTRSGLLDITVETCECAVGAEIGEITTFDYPYFAYVVSVSITNPSTAEMAVTVSVDGDQGVVVPSSVLVPASSTVTYTFTLIPANGSLSGQAVNFVFRGMTRGTQCIGHALAHMPTDSSRPAGTTANDAQKLTASPNPASDTVAIDFEIGTDFTRGHYTIDVFDLLGRKLAQYEPQQANGQWVIDSAGYGAGHYVAVLRKDGVVVRQQHIVIAH